MKTFLKDTINKLTEPSANRLRNVLIVLIVILSLVSLIVIVVQRSKSEEELAKIARINSLKTSEALTERILILQISINEDTLDSKPFELLGVSAFNAHMDNVELPSSRDYFYKLKLTNGQKTYESYFNIQTIESETVDPATGNYVKLKSTQESSKALKTPYFPEGSSVAITSPSGRVVFNGSINNINEVNNQSRYNTVAGEDVEKIQH